MFLMSLAVIYKKRERLESMCIYEMFIVVTHLERFEAA